jgi:hypothetical protein
MNLDLLQLIVRKLVTLAGGYFIGHGLITSATWTDGMASNLAGALCILISTGWSIWHQRKLKGVSNEANKEGSVK